MNILSLAKKFSQDKAVLLAENKPLCWCEFDTTLKNLVEYFHQQKEERWALCFSNQGDFLLVLLALLITAKKPVLLPNHQVGTVEKFRGEYEKVLSQMPPFTEGNQTNHTHLSIHEESEIVLFTSGSTGFPKKITRKFGTLLAEVHMLESIFGKNIIKENIYTTVSFEHVYGLIFGCLWPLITGRTVIAGNILSMDSIAEDLRTNTCKVLVTSPSFLNRLNLSEALQDNTCVFSSGGLLPAERAKYLRDVINIMPYEVLGSTETSGIGFRQQCREGLWQPFPKVCITEKDNRAYVSSPYFDGEKPQALDDQLDMLPGGKFILKGREDRVVKIEGKRLSLSELENKIKENPYVKDALGFLKVDQRESLSLALVLQEEGNAMLEAVGKHKMNQTILSWLSDYYDPILRPRKIHYLSHFPRNSQDKRVFTDIMSLCEENP